jgi:hypothetical protein
MNDRGTYGDDRRDQRDHGARPFFVVLGISAAIYALSPGAIHFYKHGRLPPDLR